MVSRCNQLIYFLPSKARFVYLCIINNKYKIVMPTKKDSTVSRKNLLGRNVTVQRKTMSDGSLLKTRTVTSKNGGTIKGKNSFKDADSLAGKMRAKKSENINKRQTKSVMKKLSKNVAPFLRKAIEEGRQEASQQVAKGAMNPGKFVKRSVREGREEVKQNIMDGVRKGVAKKYPSYKSKP
jgi:hypothetical protein